MKLGQAISGTWITLTCTVSSRPGALSFDRKRWIAARKKYLLRIQSLAKEFRKRYLDKLEKLYCKNSLSFYGRAARYRDEKNFLQLIERLRDTQWIAYAKQPFGGPEQVLEYLGRYTHRVALTNNRVLAVDDDGVQVSYRDRSDDNKEKVLVVSGEEFIRRFLLHVLPRGFTKIRYYGFLAHANKNICITLIRAFDRFNDSVRSKAGGKCPGDDAAVNWCEYRLLPEMWSGNSGGWRTTCQSSL